LIALQPIIRASGAGAFGGMALTRQIALAKMPSYVWWLQLFQSALFFMPSARGGKRHVL
jgi:hypothetical protein